MTPEAKTISLTSLQEHIVKTLLYFDIFNYPLKADEIFRFLGTNSVSEEVVTSNLTSLADAGLVYIFDGFYSMQNDPRLIERRLKGNAKAVDCLPLAKEKANTIASFPFVRAVMSSGSLSKGYMDEKSDLDFFVVTEPGKLWIARTLLVMYKRIFLSNSHKYFCVNYFVDSAHLRIEEENLFTATELATVIPLYNWELYVNLQASNKAWLKSMFPNFRPRGKETLISDQKWPLKKFAETMLSLVAIPLEKGFRKFTSSRWKRIYGNAYPKQDFDIAFKSKDYASKNHPQHFQNKVLQLHQQKMSEFASNNGIAWRA